MNRNESVVVPRAIPEGIIPLISVEGTAYECGRSYAEIVQERYPGYRTYLDMAHDWQTLPPHVKSLFETRAPQILDVYRGISDAAGRGGGTDKVPEAKGCTSFGVSGAVTLDAHPISGQTKDTVVESARLFIVLRMRIHGAPHILTLAYPGEVLGYGMWSTGMSLFRNDLPSSGVAEKRLTMAQFAFLALSGSSTEEAQYLADKFGISGAGNCLISDAQGVSVSVEFNCGGVSIVPARNGIATHANHPEGDNTAPFEDYADDIEKENSRYRMHALWRLLDAERGRLTPQKCLASLGDHSRYPRGGICRHMIGGMTDPCTTAAVVAEPTRGKLHVVRGPVCMNWPVTYAL